jgi:exodeoxyribonuclease VII small subunit
MIQYYRFSAEKRTEMKKDRIKELENLPFEEALERLEEIVDTMEAGDLQLDKMIEYFEEGNALSNICGKKLKSLEKKIEVLVKQNSGEPEWETFDPQSERQQASLKPNPPIAKEEDDFAGEDLLF